MILGNKTFESLPKEIINDPKKLAVLTLHPSWLEHRMTRVLISVLEKQKREVLSNIQSVSLNANSVEVGLRVLGVRLKTINDTLEVIYDVEKCLQQCPICD